jgi:hypothetical protein
VFCSLGPIGPSPLGSVGGREGGGGGSGRGLLMGPARDRFNLGIPPCLVGAGAPSCGAHKRREQGSSRTAQMEEHLRLQARRTSN